MKLSACLIVKNEERMLAKTLPALKSGVDEIIVVDTGSIDRTVELAKSFGAMVSHFAWINDFSAARNHSLERATGDWVVWIDADEYIRPENFQTLRRILAETDKDSFQLPIHECDIDATGGGLFYFRIKVFRNGLGLRFERPFNEQLFTADGRLFESADLLPSVRIAHWGRSLAPERMQAKKERNFEMLKKAIAAAPSDPYYHFLLANNYLDVKDGVGAMDEYRAVLACGAGSGPLATASRIRLARLLSERGENESAYEQLKDAAAEQPWNAEIFNLIALIYLTLGMTQKAIEVLEHASLLRKPENTPAEIDREQFGYLPNYLLGNAYLLVNDKGRALAAFKQANIFRPDDGLSLKIAGLEKEATCNEH